MTGFETNAVHLPTTSTRGTQDPTSKRWVKIAVSAAVAAFDRLPGRRPLAERARGVILLYHDVPLSEQARFARQLDQLLAAGTPVPCQELPGAPDGTWRIGVTFDDGLYSFERVALPELRERAIPSSMFVISSLLREAELDTTPTHEGMPVLTKASVAELPLGGVEIGSHSEHHRRLSLIDDCETSQELLNSRKQIEDLVGGPVRTLAFPYGDWSRRTVELAVETGYETVYSVNPDLIGTRRADPVVRGRVVVAPTDWPVETWLKLRGAYRWVAWWTRAKGVLRGNRP